jgi:hypothetical protein
MVFIRPGATGTCPPPELPCTERWVLEPRRHMSAPELPRVRRWEPEPRGHTASSELPCAARSCSEPGGGNRSRGDTRCPRSYPASGGECCPEPFYCWLFSGDFFLVASYCPTKNSRVLKKTPLFFSVLVAVVALTLSLSSWFLLLLLQALSQCCDVRCSSTAPTIVTGFLACVCTCVDLSLGFSHR